MEKADLKLLAEHFPKEAVHWRVQGAPYERNGKHSAMALAYIDARDVMDRLDDVCDPSDWQTKLAETPGGRVICQLGILIDGTWVWKSDGAGGTKVEGEKGGISDALKRAAVAWGVGRYLYRLSTPWVSCDVKVKNGKTYWKSWSEDPWSKVKVEGYQKPKPVAAIPQEVLNAAMGAETLEALQAVWTANIEWQKNAEFATAKETRKLELQKETV